MAHLLPFSSEIHEVLHSRSTVVNRLYNYVRMSLDKRQEPLYAEFNTRMTRLIHIAFRGEPELKASLQHEAEQRRITVSQLIRDALRREFGLLRFVDAPRNATYRRASVRGRAASVRNRKAAHVEG